MATERRTQHVSPLPQHKTPPNQSTVVGVLCSQGKVKAAEGELVFYVVFSMDAKLTSNGDHVLPFEEVSNRWP
jgi:hypothetical protein